MFISSITTTTITTTTTMKSNFKLAPLSCHCKLNVLVQHLKKISAQKAGADRKNLPINSQILSEMLFQRYI